MQTGFTVFLIKFSYKKYIITYKQHKSIYYNKNYGVKFKNYI